MLLEKMIEYFGLDAKEIQEWQRQEGVKTGCIVFNSESVPVHQVIYDRLREAYNAKRIQYNNAEIDEEEWFKCVIAYHSLTYSLATLANIVQLTKENKNNYVIFLGYDEESKNNLTDAPELEKELKQFIKYVEEQNHRVGVCCSYDDLPKIIDPDKPKYASILKFLERLRGEEESPDNSKSNSQPLIYVRHPAAFEQRDGNPFQYYVDLFGIQSGNVIYINVGEANVKPILDYGVKAFSVTRENHAWLLESIKLCMEEPDFWKKIDLQRPAEFLWNTQLEKLKKCLQDHGKESVQETEEILNKFCKLLPGNYIYYWNRIDESLRDILNSDSFASQPQGNAKLALLMEVRKKFFEASKAPDFSVRDWACPNLFNIAQKFNNEAITRSFLKYACSKEDKNYVLEMIALPNKQFEVLKDYINLFSPKNLVEDYLVGLLSNSGQDLTVFYEALAQFSGVIALTAIIEKAYRAQVEQDKLKLLFNQAALDLGDFESKENFFIKLLAAYFAQPTFHKHAQTTQPTQPSAYQFGFFAITDQPSADYLQFIFKQVFIQDIGQGLSKEIYEYLLEEKGVCAEVTQTFARMAKERGFLTNYDYAACLEKAFKRDRGQDIRYIIKERLCALDAIKKAFITHAYPQRFALLLADCPEFMVTRDELLQSNCQYFFEKFMQCLNNADKHTDLSFLKDQASIIFQQVIADPDTQLTFEKALNQLNSLARLGILLFDPELTKMLVEGFKARYGNKIDENEIKQLCENLALKQNAMVIDEAPFIEKLRIAVNNNDTAEVQMLLKDAELKTILVDDKILDMLMESAYSNGNFLIFGLLLHKLERKLSDDEILARLVNGLHNLADLNMPPEHIQYFFEGLLLAFDKIMPTGKGMNDERACALQFKQLLAKTGSQALMKHIDFLAKLAIASSEIIGTLSFDKFGKQLVEALQKRLASGNNQYARQFKPGY